MTLKEETILKNVLSSNLGANGNQEATKKNVGFKIKQICGKSRSCILTLPHGNVNTPIFMPVGTRGAVKGIFPEELKAIGYNIILGNTYHLAETPGTQILKKHGGLHKFMHWGGNILTDSGGFQMVSLLELTNVSEDGVQFKSPIDGSIMLLRPEKSMEIQHIIKSDIMMALDDVVSSTCKSENRVKEATERTLRWLDRCEMASNSFPDQFLYGIVQGGLDSALRTISLKNFKNRNLTGYAIGGLSGGESKNLFWRTVNQCCNGEYSLEKSKPRYLMGVGYPLDILISVALGVDMFDCVYPTRTARFGTALTSEGSLVLKRTIFASDFRPLCSECKCEACIKYTRSFFHYTISKEPTALRLLTLHNLRYMFNFCTSMQEAIENNTFPEFAIDYIRQHYPDAWKDDSVDKLTNNLNDQTIKPPVWIRDALECSGIPINNFFHWDELYHKADDNLNHYNEYLL